MTDDLINKIIDLCSRHKFVAARILLREMKKEIEDLKKKARPPGHTCPAIDDAQSALRKLHWRAKNPNKKTKVTADEVLEFGLLSLEQVRKENIMMRKAYHDATEKSI